MREKATEMGEWRAWLHAIRPKTLTAGFTPIVVAGAIAISIEGRADLLLLFSALLASVAIQSGTNLINDAIDFKRGADGADRLGPMRITQQGLFTPQEVLRAGFIAFFLAFLFAIPLLLKGGVIIALLLALSFLCGYLYTGGPYPLAYVGLGELFVMIFYGFVCVGVVSWLLVDSFSGKALLAGGQLGALATVILSMNNLRDIETDSKCGKKTLAVRFGQRFACWEITLLLATPFALLPLWMRFEGVAAAQLPLLSLPLALIIGRGVWTVKSGGGLNRFFGLTAILHFSFGMLLALGLLSS